MAHRPLTLSPLWQTRWAPIAAELYGIPSQVIHRKERYDTTAVRLNRAGTQLRSIAPFEYLQSAWLYSDGHVYAHTMNGKDLDLGPESALPRPAEASNPSKPNHPNAARRTPSKSRDHRFDNAYSIGRNITLYPRKARFRS